MEVVILPDASAVARYAADLVASAVTADPAAVFGVATGSSPLGVYAALAERVRAGHLSFGAASAFALDEYVGLAPDARQSYARVVGATVTAPLGFDPTHVHVPDGRAADPHAAARAFDTAIAAAGGVALQLLGVGTNGHIGFNEPTSSFASRTRVKTLAPRTRADNARFFGGDPAAVPLHCITQGLGTILEARRLVLVAQGAGKAQAIAGLVEGPVTSLMPGSALQLHPDAVVVIDEAAASGLQLADYYRYVQQHKI